MVAAAAPVAFAFEAFEGQLRVSRGRDQAAADRRRRTASRREFVQTEGMLRPIIHLPSFSKRS